VQLCQASIRVELKNVNKPLSTYCVMNTVLTSRWCLETWCSNLVASFPGPHPAPACSTVKGLETWCSNLVASFSGPHPAPACSTVKSLGTRVAIWSLMLLHTCTQTQQVQWQHREVGSIRTNRWMPVLSGDMCRKAHSPVCSKLMERLRE